MEYFTQSNVSRETERDEMSVSQSSDYEDDTETETGVDSLL